MPGSPPLFYILFNSIPWRGKKGNPSPLLSSGPISRGFRAFPDPLSGKKRQFSSLTLDGQRQIRFFGAEIAHSFVFLIDGRQPACFVSLPGHDFRSRKTPEDFPASKNRGWRGRGRRWGGLASAARSAETRSFGPRLSPTEDDDDVQRLSGPPESVSVLVNRG